MLMLLCVFFIKCFFPQLAARSHSKWISPRCVFNKSEFETIISGDTAVNYPHTDKDELNLIRVKLFLWQPLFKPSTGHKSCHSPFSNLLFTVAVRVFFFFQQRATQVSSVQNSVSFSVSYIIWILAAVNSSGPSIAISIEDDISLYSLIKAVYP